jgi:hypothetical protein
MLHGEKLEALPLKSETRQGCPLTLLLLSTLLEFLARIIKEGKETKRMQIEKDESNYLFAGSMIVFLKRTQN